MAATAAVAPLRKQDAGTKQGALPVTQAELQAVTDTWGHMERLAADIRCRLEAGAEMERGTLGASTFGYEPIDWYRENGIGTATSTEGICGLSIGPVKQLAPEAELLKKYPDCPGWVLI